MLKIQNVTISNHGRRIINNLTLHLKDGETLILMGTNGSGKSSLALGMMGHPDYRLDDGEITYHDEVLSDLTIDERARKGLFVAFQNPVGISGLKVHNFLREGFKLYQPEKIDQFRVLVKDALEELNLSDEIMNKNLNQDFSGGEKKKLELLQIKLFRPKIVIFDETDSGLDMDSTKTFLEFINLLDCIKIIITHYPELAKQTRYEQVAVLHHGEIIKLGDTGLLSAIAKIGLKGVIGE